MMQALGAELLLPLLRPLPPSLLLCSLLVLPLSWRSSSGALRTPHLVLCCGVAWRGVACPAEKKRQQLQAEVQKRENMKREMLAANELTLRMKVGALDSRALPLPLTRWLASPQQLLGRPILLLSFPTPRGCPASPTRAGGAPGPGGC